MCLTATKIIFYLLLLVSIVSTWRGIWVMFDELEVPYYVNSSLGMLGIIIFTYLLHMLGETRLIERVVTDQLTNDLEQSK